MNTIEVVVQEDRVVVTLNRPEARNAINSEMINDLHDVCTEIEIDPKMLLLTGSGGHFAAGADIGELLDRRHGEALLGINSRLFDRISKLPLPTLAAVDGSAIGGGAELSYACDLRLASRSAIFGNPEPGLGIIAAAGACWRLSELVGKSVAKQVLLGGRMLSAEDAMNFGLISEVVDSADLLSESHALLDQIALASPTALRLTKLVLDATQTHPLADDLAQAILFDSEEKQTRMQQFLGKKKP